MKAIFILLIGAIALSACNKASNIEKHIAVSAIVDITDKRALCPISESIIPIFGLGADESNKVTFRISTLSDKQVNEDIEIRLSGKEESEKQNVDDDVNFRKREIVGLYNTIRDTTNYFIHQQIKRDSMLDNSECFRSIASELSRMFQRGIDTGTLLVFSDIQEHSQILNCYSNQERISNHPEKIEKLLESKELLPASLKGITIFFVYKPLSKIDDNRFMNMAMIYKKLLQKRGAVVKIQAQNQSYLL
jgi:hypothetical protein